MENREKRRSGIFVSSVSPRIDCGRFPVKRAVNDVLRVTADVMKPGHDLLSVSLKIKHESEKEWNELDMEPDGNDGWTAEFKLTQLGTYDYTVCAWTDTYATLLRNMQKWHASGEDIHQDSIQLIEFATEWTRDDAQALPHLEKLANALSAHDFETLLEEASSPEFTPLVRARQPRTDLVEYGKTLQVVVDDRRAVFSSWYELFPRSQSTQKGKHGTFRDVVSRLDDISRMGFDVLYLTPIHPIGVTARRGKNNSLPASSDDVGSPWAIGNEYGGHKSVDPNLGTLDDFKNLVHEAERRGIRVALDLAFQCSPDHPYVKEHPSWFFHRPDGSIRYAENPPKKYPDIYPFNFDAPDWKDLWNELASVVEFWIAAGVKVFRVDNPHTKPFAFWEWLIKKVKKRHHDVIFLSEAFTRPKVMYTLAKLGFTQSYTYFTWKNYDYEIKEYFTELSSAEVTEFFRPMLFTNTPDILTPVLQNGGRPAFKMRAVLAATLSPLWGIYSGYELVENQAKPGTEEYMDSEKYQIKQRDWDAPGNIKQFISTLNRIRAENSCLQTLGHLKFLEVDNPNLLFYTRWSDDGVSRLFIAVNINPYERHSGFVEMPVKEMGLSESAPYTVRDLLTGERYVWRGVKNFISLTPDLRPAHILEVEK
ncbi:MAG: alpha-1,4-glucan--maltose-1-phosphate maltosyltransferase [Candidatus Marsarchaeota archaeon]|nr:alpha-1,4-glucan--maltose-1-phosphate maltosyltransferase [Candidatus Marsarchaeota archaeon]